MNAPLPKVKIFDAAELHGAGGVLALQEAINDWVERTRSRIVNITGLHAGASHVCVIYEPADDPASVDGGAHELTDDDYFQR